MLLLFLRGVPVGCASTPITYDVWYSFTAKTTNPTITLGSVGSAFTNSRLQLFSEHVVRLLHCHVVLQVSRLRG